MSRFIRRSIPAAAVALVAAAPFAAAQQQGQQLFEWSGRVDREVQISMRGNRVATRDIGDNEPGRERSRVFMQIPRQDGLIGVQLLNGRGSATVIEQPSARNGYTATVRIQDPSSGADNYRLVAYWQNYSNGDIYGRNNNGRVVDRNHDGVDDRNERGRGADARERNGGTNGGTNGAYDNGQLGSQNVLHWSGNVDGELEIRIQNGRVSYRTLNGALPTSVRADGTNAAAQRTSSMMSVVQNQGRGTVTLVEQPSSLNAYTTVIRVRDPQGGYGFYDFDLMMR